MSREKDTLKEDFLEQVKHTLDERAEQFDELTLSRLSAARHRAVDAARRRSAIPGPGNVLSLLDNRRGLMAGAASFVIVVAVVLMLNFSPRQSISSPSLLEDLELLGAVEELEFYEDLEFYLWVTDEEATI